MALQYIKLVMFTNIYPARYRRSIFNRNQRFFLLDMAGFLSWFDFRSWMNTPLSNSNRIYYMYLQIILWGLWSQLWANESAAAILWQTDHMTLLCAERVEFKNIWSDCAQMLMANIFVNNFQTLQTKYQFKAETISSNILIRC